MDRERRYPPTPYAPRSEETRLYRDGWDLGWRHLGTMGVARTRDYLDGLSDGPSRHGYRDGARARWRYEQKATRARAEARREDREIQRRENARLAQEEGPY